MQHFETSWKSADGLNLFAQGWEPEQDILAVLCLVHGLGENSSRYAHMAAAMNAAGFAVLTYDLRGHGRSEGRRGHIPAYESLMEDVALLLAQAAERYPAAPLFLYGQSLGGNQVINYALRRKPAIAGVIASSPELRLAFDPPKLKVALGKLLYRLAPAIQMANGLDVNALSHDPAIAKAYKSDPLNHDRITPRLGLDMLATGEWALQHAAEFPLPLLLMHGSADRLTSVKASREFAGRLGKDCTYKEWEGLYHEVHNEPEQGQVFALMVEWMGQHLEPAGQIGALMAKSSPQSTKSH